MRVLYTCYVVVFSLYIKMSFSYLIITLSPSNSIASYHIQLFSNYHMIL